MPTQNILVLHSGISSCESALYILHKFDASLPLLIFVHSWNFYVALEAQNYGIIFIIIYIFKCSIFFHRLYKWLKWATISFTIIYYSLLKNLYDFVITSPYQQTMIYVDVSHGKIVEAFKIQFLRACFSMNFAKHLTNPPWNLHIFSMMKRGKIEFSHNQSTRKSFQNKWEWLEFLPNGRSVHCVWVPSVNKNR